jgi:tetratricopeptide (TPR) repeat protein
LIQCTIYLLFLILRHFQDALAQLGDLEASLVEYKSAIIINERMLGKFHVKMASVYSKLAGILMDKEQFEAALSFYCKAYGIFDATLGLHDDTKRALMDVKLAAASCRESGQSNVDLLVNVEKEFKKRHPSVSGEDELGPYYDNEDETEEGNSDGKKKKKKVTGKKKKKKKDVENNGNKENKANQEEFDII